MVRFCLSVFILALWPGTSNPADLGSLAAGVKAGEWKDITPPGDFGRTFIKCPTTGHIFQYAEGGVWDPNREKVYFVGHAHYSCWRFLSYDGKTDMWEKEPLAGWMSGLGHAYDHNTINPRTGVFYHHKNYTKNIHKYDPATRKWTTLPEMSVPGYWACCNGLAYFPEMKGLVMANNGGVYYYNEILKTWSQPGKNLAMGNLNNIAEYNPVHKVVVLGGGNGGNTLFRMDSLAKIQPLSTPPVTMSVTQSVLTVDPVSGQFLVLGNDETFREFDVMRDTWKTLPGKPPIYAHARNTVGNIIAIPISTHGVIMFISWDFSNSAVFLYRHTAGNGTGVTFTQKTSRVPKMTVFPNPATGKIPLRVTLPSLGSQVTVYNVSGHRVRDFGTVHNRHFQLKTKALAPGIYFIKAKKGNLETTAKVFVSR